ncbi:MAG: hypothetical protein ABJF04_17340 [Reichenbachiella sp.]|uniref:hypothetical protein n=1 Tax=Reichenbachiella sp. TaxID=2184521 RepID=UPI003264C1EA
MKNIIISISYIVLLGIGLAGCQEEDLSPPAIIESIEQPDQSRYKDSFRKINKPIKATFILNLNRLIRGKQVKIKNAKCKFTYTWDPQKARGMGRLISIGGVKLNIDLSATGLLGKLAFVSAKSKTAVIEGEVIFIKTVALDIDLKNNQKSAAILFEEDFSWYTQATQNWEK